jgi:hypothetical protein
VSGTSIPAHPPALGGANRLDFGWQGHILNADRCVYRRPSRQRRIEMLKKMSILAPLLVALLISLVACKVQVPEKLANALAEKISGKKTEQAGEGASGQQEPATQAYTRDIVHDDVTVNAGEYHYYAVSVTPRMEEARITGHFTARGGLANSIVVLVLDGDGFTNWSNNHDVSTYYNSGKTTTGTLNVHLRQPGTYYLVLSNRFSTVLPRHVQTDMVLGYKQ